MGEKKEKRRIPSPCLNLGFVKGKEKGRFSILYLFFSYYKSIIQTRPKRMPCPKTSVFYPIQWLLVPYTEMGLSANSPRGDRERCHCRVISRRVGLMISLSSSVGCLIFSISCLIFLTWLWTATPSWYLSSLLGFLLLLLLVLFFCSISGLSFIANSHLMQYAPINYSFVLWGVSNV